MIILRFHMTDYRNSKLIERYEDVVFELETALNTVIANGADQIKTNHRFVVDNSGESTPFGIGIMLDSMLLLF